MKQSADDSSTRSGSSPIGFAGLGDIGLPMAQRLLDTGLGLVVYNRTRSRARSLIGRDLRVVDSPAQIVSHASIIVTCLHGPDADRAVYMGERGLTSVDLQRTLVVNTSTIGPQLARELNEAVRSRGGCYLDAPILGGGRAAAAAGELLLPIGGPEETVQRAEPLLARLASRIHHVGSVGAAQQIKLINNLLVAVGAASLAQAVEAARGCGIDSQVLAEILPNASSQSRVMDMYLPKMVSGSFDRRGTLRTLAKDIDLAIELTESSGQQMTVARSARTMFRRALDAGLGEMEVPALVAAMEYHREL